MGIAATYCLILAVRRHAAVLRSSSTISPSAEGERVSNTSTVTVASRPHCTLGGWPSSPPPLFDYHVNGTSLTKWIDSSSKISMLKPIHKVIGSLKRTSRIINQEYLNALEAWDGVLLSIIILFFNIWPRKIFKKPRVTDAVDKVSNLWSL
ncbi:hypothetical protein J6590_050823 [Homalodisca vitripennis]|nr:hypothetical protein J6590_050823 [Homalodisca vitripennis]